MYRTYPGGGFPRILPPDTQKNVLPKFKGFSPQNIKSVDNIIQSQDITTKAEELANIITVNTDTTDQRGGTLTPVRLSHPVITLHYLKMINRLPK